MDTKGLLQSEGSASLLVGDTQISVGVKTELSTTNRHQLLDQFYEVTVMAGDGQEGHRT